MAAKSALTIWLVYLPRPAGTPMRWVFERWLLVGSGHRPLWWRNVKGPTRRLFDRRLFNKWLFNM